ncbi:hypothetical protein [Methanohalophilus euhalobius]|nr:hypothetical protein [Methanohalophilus euhalobius]ODV50127.1 MAG: hypothetical protein A8273_786 [Methanohalophilus sp. 2-GBenrich]
MKTFNLNQRKWKIEMISKNNIFKTKILSFILSLVCVSFGMLFVNFGVRTIGVPSGYWWVPFFNVEPIYYISIGIGVVFIVTAIFFVKECFRIT